MPSDSGHGVQGDRTLVARTRRYVMRRLITVFALIAALFVLMGCGMGSKGNQEPTPKIGTQVVPEPVSYKAPADGLYKDGNGEILVAGKTLTDKEGLLVQISEFEKKLEGISAEDTTAKEEINKGMDAKKVELESLVAFHLTSMSFSISHDENNQYHIADLAIETKEDKDVPVLGEDGQPKKKENSEEIMTKKEHYFGDLNKITLSDVVSFDPEVGLSFSFKTGEGESELLYTFKGITSEEMVEKEDRNFNRVILSGNIEISSKDEIKQYGKWSVSQEIEIPAEKPAEEAPAVPQEDTEAGK